MSYLRRKKWVVASIVMASIILAPSLFISATAIDSFSDINEDTPHVQHIDYLYSEGIINGFPDKTFRPQENIQRINVVEMIFNALDLEEGNPELLTFDDVSDRMAGKVVTLVELGIISGYSEDVFEPKKNISRAEVAKILTIAFDLETDVDDQGFTDNEEGIFYDDINALGASGIADGYPNGEFGINDPIKRRDFSAFLSRVMAEELEVTDIQ